MSSLDKIVTPTEWQKSQFPVFIRDSIQVLHEGIDFDLLSSLRSAPKCYPSCISEFKDIQVLTYVSRCFEPYRGFPQAIRAISTLQSMRPNLHVLLVGSDGTAYGPGRSDGMTWTDWALQNVQLDPLRTH